MSDDQRIKNAQDALVAVKKAKELIAQLYPVLDELVETWAYEDEIEGTGHIAYDYFMTGESKLDRLARDLNEELSQ